MIASLSDLLYAGWVSKQSSITRELIEANTLPFGLGVISAISPIVVDGAYDGSPSTQISPVRIGRRTCSCSAFGWQKFRFVSGLSHPRECHSPTQATQS